MARAPDWSESELTTLLEHNGLSSEELTDYLPGRSIDAIDIVRSGIHRFHENGDTAMNSLSEKARRLLAQPGKWTCPVCTHKIT